jgi:hypothetical protein
MLTLRRTADATTGPPTGPATGIKGHRLFAVVFAAAAALRVITMLGYRPAILYWYDSYAYLDTAVRLRPPPGLHPIGYPLLLWSLLPFHSVVLVAAVQHAMGLGIGLMIYAVARRRGLPGWGATLATLPPLFDASFLRLEHAILSDTLFILLVVAALTVLLWAPAISVRGAAGAGLLLAWATLTRTVALPLLVVAGCYLVVHRAGRRAGAALVLAGALPLAAYAGWYHHDHGRYGLTDADGVALWARTMTFADCRTIKPPPAEAGLCPNGSYQDAASEYVWAPDSPINRLPGGAAGNNDRARAFALRAIAAQPLDYLGDVARDTALTFAWTPVRHPRRIRPAFGFARGDWGPPADPLAERARRDYDPSVHVMRSVEPYATFLIGYQYPAYLRGPMLGAILLFGAAGAAGALGRRRASLLPWSVLPWSVAMCLLVAPVAVLDFDHRYVLPVVPVACLAAVVAVTDLRAAAWRHDHRSR